MKKMFIRPIAPLVKRATNVSFLPDVLVASYVVVPFNRSASVEVKEGMKQRRDAMVLNYNSAL